MFTFSELTQQEAALIINTLAQQPYAQVAALIDKLAGQFKEQERMSMVRNITGSSATE